MIFRFPVNISLFRPSEGWLTLVLDDSVAEVELILDKSITVTPNLLSSIISGNTRYLYSITSIMFTRESLEYNSICVDNTCFSASRCTYVRGAAYGIPVRIEVQVQTNVIPVYELSRVLRPRVMAMLGLSKVSEMRIRSSLEYREALKAVKLRYEFPVISQLPDVLTRDLARVLSDPALIRELEDYILGLATETALRHLKTSGILTNDGVLTRLGQVLILCLAPYMLSSEHIESLKSLVLEYTKSNSEKRG